MTTNTQPSFTDTLASECVPNTWQGDLTVARAANGKGQERVFITDGEGRIVLILTRTEAADLGSALTSTSDMASCNRDAIYLAKVHRERLAREGISIRRASRESGISRNRVGELLEAWRPMTVAEHKALSNVGR